MEENRDSVANESFVGFHRVFGLLEFSQNSICRRRDIGQGIDQRSIEVEDNG